MIGDTRELFEAAKAAMTKAHAPYSGFPVGAALRSASGAIHAGCNVENASYPEVWCAETTALAHMVMAGEREVVEIAVVAAKMPLVTPCGGCRQRLKEFGRPETLIHLCTPEGIAETTTLGELLPRAFGVASR